MRAWELVNRDSSSAASSFFWIGGAAGVGKTHFLNYVLSLERNAGARSMDEERRLTLALIISPSMDPTRLTAVLIDRIARELGGAGREATLWRGLDSIEGLRIALSEAYRLGVRRLTLAIDLDECDPSRFLDYFKDVATIIKSRKPLPIIMLVAGRGRAPGYAVNLDVAARDAQEAMLAGVARARELMPAAYEALDDFYADAQQGHERTFPFHPETLRVLLALATPGCAISGLARLAREALGAGEHRPNLALRRLVLPSDLGVAGGLARRVESLIGEVGRAALKAGYAAASMIGNDNSELARRIVDTLVLACLDGRELELEELCAVLPKGSGNLAPRVRDLLEQLAQSANGAIRFDDHTARFNPRLPEAGKLALFNAAIPVLRRLNPSLLPAQEAEDLQLMLGRLRDTVAEALELARDVSEKLSALALAEHAEIPAQYVRGLREITILLSQGPTSLLEAAADPCRAEELAQTFESFRTLTVAAALAPRVLAMRRYVEATGLLDGEDLSSSPAARGRTDTQSHEQIAIDEPHPLAALRLQARLSAAELTFRLPFSSRGAFDAAEARFAKFRAEYARYYRASHALWQEEIKQLSRQAQDMATLLEVLRRLNSIALLGPPEGAHLASEFTSCSRQIVACDLPPDDCLPEEGARCPECGYALGAKLPRLDAISEKINRAVQRKLAGLSQRAIKRLIKIHDRAGRLEGFLKIVQAAQADVLARVLDDDLTSYLRRLLDEPQTHEDKLQDQAQLDSLSMEKRLFSGRRSAYHIGPRTIAPRTPLANRSRHKPPPRSK
jgi:hypothetical protein